MTNLEISLLIVCLSLLGAVFMLIWALQKLNTMVERLEMRLYQLGEAEEAEWWRRDPFDRWADNKIHVPHPDKGF